MSETAERRARPDEPRLERRRGRRGLASATRSASGARRRSLRCASSATRCCARAPRRSPSSAPSSPPRPSGWSRSCATRSGSASPRPSSACCGGCSSSRPAPTRAPTALANPEIEWISEELATAEEGCLSLPGIGVDVERAAARPRQRRRRRRRAAADRGLGPRGAGAPARDRPPRRGPDPRPDEPRAAQGRAAGAARGRRPTRPKPEPPEDDADDGRRAGLRPVYLGTSDFAATVLRRLAELGAPPGARRHAARPPQRAGAGRLTPPPAAEAARELGIDVLPGRERQRRAGTLERDPRRRPRPRRRLRLRPADPRAAAVRARCSTSTRRCCRAGAARRRSSARSWPATRRTGVTIMRLTEGLDSGPVALASRSPIGGRRLRRPSRRLASSAASCSSRALDLRARASSSSSRAGRRAATYAEKIEPAERRLDPPRPAAELERRVRALTPHIGAYLELAGGERLGVRAARAVDGELERGRLADDGGLAARLRRGRARARSRCSRRAAADGRARTTCAATRCRG